MRSIRFLILVFSLLIVTENIDAQGMITHTILEERLRSSELIIEGKVIDKTSFWGEDGKMIYTSNKIELYKVLSGEVRTQTIEIITIGGQIDGHMVKADPSLKLSIGQIGIFLLIKYAGNKIDNSRNMIWWPVAENASFLGYGPELQKVKDVFEDRAISRVDLYERIENSVKTNYREILEFPKQNNNRFLVPAITNITPLTVTAGTETLITITGTDFGGSGGTVFFDFANDGSGGSYTSASSYHIQSWSATTITVWVPSGSGTGKIFVLPWLTVL